MQTLLRADGHLPTAGHGTAAWMLGLSLATITLLSPAALFAEVLDDFNDAGLTAQRWDCQVLNDQGGYQVTNGQVQLFITPDASRL